MLILNFKLCTRLEYQKNKEQERNDGKKKKRDTDIRKETKSLPIRKTKNCNDVDKITHNRERDITSPFIEKKGRRHPDFLANKN